MGNQPITEAVELTLGYWQRHEAKLSRVALEVWASSPNAPLDCQLDRHGASSASNCVALHGRPVKGAPSGRVATAMALGPPSTVPPFQAVSGSYRMRHLYVSAR